jgi:WhiB family transcriptional regulator, redox-sensing transcriptional regulator
MPLARPQTQQPTTDLPDELLLAALAKPAPYPRRSDPRSVGVAGRPPAEALAILLEPVLPGWSQSADCREVDIDVFYPEPMTAKTAQPAKRICHGCPVRESCLRFALATRDRQGIFGGTTPAERRVLHYNVAVAALSLAGRVGVRAAARQLGAKPYLLYRAWDLWGLGRPSRPAAKAVG